MWCVMTVEFAQQPKNLLYSVICACTRQQCCTLPHTITTSWIGPTSSNWLYPHLRTKCSKSTTVLLQSIVQQCKSIEQVWCVLLGMYNYLHIDIRHKSWKFSYRWFFVNDIHSATDKGYRILQGGCCILMIYTCVVCWVSRHQNESESEI